VLTSPLTITAPERTLPLPDGPLSLTVDDLDFRYDDSLKHYGRILKITDGHSGGGRRHALREIRFEAPVGGYVAIVGRVGSGKSTLLKTVQRLIEVPPGTVHVGGVDVTEVDLDELRRRVGYVPQGDFLFSTTLFDNIAYGRPDADRTAIAQAAAIAGLTADLEVLPDGLDTKVGERGGTLSGGQRQRVALARAILIDPSILVLDNALSNVDAETERAILDRLRARLAVEQRRTLIVASNRIGAIQDADRIYVMDGGRIVDSGNHDELAARPGLYADMFERQRLSDQLERL